MQARAAEDLRRLATGALKAEGLEFDTAASYVTPRRIALVVDGLPLAQPDRREEKRGPRAGAPEKAIQGFLRANDATIEMCVERDDYLYLSTETEGSAVASLLPGIVGGLIGGLAWPKSMRWGGGETRWVRTLERVLCVFDGKPVSLDLADGIASGGIATGHRFHAPEPFAVGFLRGIPRAPARGARHPRPGGAAPDRRRRRGGAGGSERGADREGRSGPARRDRRVGRVAGAADRADRRGIHGGAGGSAGHRDAEPPEVSDAAQPRRQPRATLRRRRQSRGGRRRKGNRRRQRARVAGPAVGRALLLGPGPQDAGSRTGWARSRRWSSTRSWETWRRRPNGWKSWRERSPRSCPDADAGAARRAGRLAKADLTAEMVFEFPELQGTMGGHYARCDGEGEDVALAVAEHYLPVGPSGTCPSTPVKHRRRARRQDRHADRLLRGRRAAHRIGRSLCAEAGRARRHPPGAGERRSACRCTRRSARHIGAMARRFRVSRIRSKAIIGPGRRNARCSISSPTGSRSISGPTGCATI